MADTGMPDGGKNSMASMIRRMQANTAHHVRPRTREHDVTSKEIDGTTDLVVWAPIKDGFIDAFANVTHESRLRLVAEALHSLRKSAREYEHLEPYADTAKRILSLLDFRIGIVDRDLFEPDKTDDSAAASAFRPRKYMYLVATFAGPWEPYMRQIHDPLGTFLDLVLCNCEGYVTATEHGFEEYAKWVRDHQLDSAIFYSTSGMSTGDKIYLEELEKIQREQAPDDADREIARHAFKTPDDAAADVQAASPKDALRLGLEALNVLYKLTDMYPPRKPDGTPTRDGTLLKRATQDLLLGLDRLLTPLLKPQDGTGRREVDERRIDSSLVAPINWFLEEIKPRTPPAKNPPFEESEVQKGLLSSYDSDAFTATHGALLLIRIDDAGKVRDFLDSNLFSWEGDEPMQFGPLSPFFTNIAFTYSGLRHLGIPEAELATFPKEFREGMKNRAAQIGDKYHNHPRNWKLPKRNWPPETARDAPPIEPHEIDLVIQIRAQVQYDEELDHYLEFTDPMDQVRPHVDAFFSGERMASLEEFLAPSGIASLDIPGENIFNLLVAFFQGAGERYGFSILGIESMFRPGRFKNREENTSRSLSPTANLDHFGFQDGISQPKVQPGTKLPDDAGPLDILRGDLIYGHANTLGDLPDTDQTERLAFNGSFLVVRKIAQHVERMKAFDEACAMQRGIPDASALLVGRTKDGKALVDPDDPTNTFTYDADPNGEHCPFSAHIRLANPRDKFLERPAPKILRRGMTYGPSHEDANDADRGIMFMAFCASIAEQYEVIQRWLNGANPSRVSASRNDPLTGSRNRPDVDSHTFTCIVDGKTERFTLTEPLTTLAWGDYFFVPSRAALQRIADAANDRVFLEMRQGEVRERIESGERLLAKLKHMPLKAQQEEWKRVIEDFLTKDPKEHDVTPKIWQAIESLGGVYKVESGIAFDQGSGKPEQKVILVTDEARILDILGRGEAYAPGTFSSSEQHDRILAGFGTIYVCLDDGETYREEADHANDILTSYSRESAVRAGYKAGQSVLQKAIKYAEAMRQRDPDAFRDVPKAFKMELGRQYIQPSLAALCQAWYGIPDGLFFKDGPWSWDTDRKCPVCPGDFMATSLHTFFPRPSSTIQEYGRVHGRSIHEAGLKYVEAVWAQDPDTDPIGGTIARKLHKEMRKRAAKHPSRTPEYQDLLARNMIGGMIGAIAPMDSCLRWALHDWLSEQTLWTFQNTFMQRLAAHTADANSNAVMDAALEAVLPALQSAMCVRPAPDLLYRTVTADHVKIGDVEAGRGDLVILGLSAATQSNLRKGNNDVSVVFGGTRKLPCGNPNPDTTLHACPAQDLALGGMTGILAALLDVGRIKALPAALIVEISDWTRSSAASAPH